MSMSEKICLGDLISQVKRMAVAWGVLDHCSIWSGDAWWNLRHETPEGLSSRLWSKSGDQNRIPAMLQFWIWAAYRLRWDEIGWHWPMSMWFSHVFTTFHFPASKATGSQAPDRPTDWRWQRLDRVSGRLGRRLDMTWRRGTWQRIWT